MSFLKRIRPIIETDWFLSFMILVIFLLTNGYKYAWDDQHLEIPLLKSLIDPSLFVGDYYVESLKKNFTSFFYPLLARVISVAQVPAAYFVLYLASRYFFFYGLLKFWKWIAGKREAAFLCVSMFILIGRVPEFLYRTFSHQEFALAFILGGIYLFYKERFLLAAAVLGLAANFHAIYSLFPMIYLGVFLLINIKRYGFKTLLKSSLIFLMAALPFLIWSHHKILSAFDHHQFGSEGDWLALYQLACPQNFVFLNIPVHLILKSLKVFLMATQPYLLLLSLFVLNFCHHPVFRKDKKTLVISVMTLIFVGISFYFTYIHPNRFIIDLNLVRNTQFLLLLLMGYTTILTAEVVEQSTPFIGFCAAALLGLLGFGDWVAALATMAMMFLLAIVKESAKGKEGKRFLIALYGVLLLGCLAGIGVSIFSFKYNVSSVVKMLTAPSILLVVYLSQRIISFKSNKDLFWGKRIFIPIVLLVMTVQYGQLHWRHLKAVKSGGGFWQLQRGWEDMQRFVQKNTPKNALLLVPNDMEMGGFRILSERKVVVCYRDCGIIGFDYQAALEWQKRLADVEAFKVILDKSFKSALINALLKYKVDYIVFVHYYAPTERIAGMDKIYENDSFSLFKVNFSQPAL